MISEEVYNKAKHIVKLYEDEQLIIHNVMRTNKENEQIKREQNCGEHHYKPQGKWKSGMKCDWCGKTID